MEGEAHFGLGDFFLVAEAVLEIPAEQVARVTNIPLADSACAAPYASFGGQAFYPDPVERAAILCSRIVRNHALPDGNKRVGLVAMRSEFKRLGYTWTANGDIEVATVITALAAGELTETEFVEWVQAHAHS
jgi:death-on-curing protein